MTRNFDDEKKEPQPIIIQDLRHSRAGEEEAEAEPEATEAQAEAVAPPEPAAQEPPVMEVLEPVPPAAPAEQVLDGHDHAAHAHDGHEHPGHEHADAEGQEIGEEEYRQVLQIFELGLENYQKSQLGIYIQFALIHLGRMPHPVTGLVATDTAKARFAIDLLHVCFSHLEPGLQPAELKEFQSVLAQLQMTYAQLAGNAPLPPEPEA